MITEENDEKKKHGGKEAKDEHGATADAHGRLDRRLGRLLKELRPTMESMLKFTYRSRVFDCRARRRCRNVVGF